MNFSEAFEQVKQGKGMRLPHWKQLAVKYGYQPLKG